MTMHQDILQILVSEEEILAKLAVVGPQIAVDYKDKNPLVIGVLKGSLPFMMDLIKKMDIHIELDFMDVSSYGDATVSSGQVKIIKDLNNAVEGRDVLIVEDIVDTGLTLTYLADLLRYRKAKSVKIVTLLDKPSGRKVEITPDYCCFTVPNEFVVGYGLDYQERYRNLPYVGVLKPAIYQK